MCPRFFSSWWPILGGVFISIATISSIRHWAWFTEPAIRRPRNHDRLCGSWLAYRRRRPRCSRINFFRPRVKVVIFGAACIRGALCRRVIVLPQLFQKFVVQPSELSMELPYLKSYIEFTRKAYGWTRFRKPPTQPWPI